MPVAQIFTAEPQRAQSFLAPTAVVLLLTKQRNKYLGTRRWIWEGEGRQVGDIEILWVCHEEPERAIPSRDGTLRL